MGLKQKMRNERKFQKTEGNSETKDEGKAKVMWWIFEEKLGALTATSVMLRSPILPKIGGNSLLKVLRKRKGNENIGAQSQ